MNRQFLKAAVAGGDTRQVYLAEALGENGFLVKTYGLPKDPGHSQVKKASSLREALVDADLIAAPVPFLKQGKIQGQEFSIDLTEKNFLKYLKKGSLFCAGGIPEDYFKKPGKSKRQYLPGDRVWKMRQDSGRLSPEYVLPDHGLGKRQGKGCPGKSRRTKDPGGEGTSPGSEAAGFSFSDRSLCGPEKGFIEIYKEGYMYHRHRLSSGRPGLSGCQRPGAFSFTLAGHTGKVCS